MDIESVFLRAMFQATDNWILRGGPEPNDKALLALAPELAGLIAAANEQEDDEDDGMEWTPVSERPPDDLEQCLVARGEDVGIAWWHSGPQKFIHEDIDNAWIPTHWMPLQAPPRDDK
jgi:hypothetical protein